MRYSIVLPTFNEAENIASMIDRLMALSLPELEILVVDDHSPDQTMQAAQTAAEKYPGRVSAVYNPGTRGLSPSVVYGFTLAKGDILICMDADGQHRPEDLPPLLKRFEEGWDMVIGSRHVTGGGFTQKWNPFRSFASSTAAAMARVILGIRVMDPMSGFFAVRKTAFERIRPALSPSGFKIMLEIFYLLTLAGCFRILEHGIVFDMRKFGKSKLSGRVIVQYLKMLAAFRFGKKNLLRKINGK